MIWSSFSSVVSNRPEYFEEGEREGAMRSEEEPARMVVLRNGVRPITTSNSHGQQQPE
jgi:hypothetical protein